MTVVSKIARMPPGLLLCFLFIYMSDESSFVYSSRILPVIKRSKLKCVSNCVESSEVLNVKAVASDTFLSCAAKAIWLKRNKKKQRKSEIRKRHKCMSNILRFTFIHPLVLAI